MGVRKTVAFFCFLSAPALLTLSCGEGRAPWERDRPGFRQHLLEGGDMRYKIAIGLVGLAALAAGGCKDSTGPDVQSLIGTWRATKAEYVSVANPSTKVDIVAQGSTLTLVLNASSYVLTITDPGMSPEVTNGTWSKTIDPLTLTPSGGSSNAVFDMSLNSDTLTLTGGGAWFDFTAGNFEDAKLNLILARQ
jgi:hypothetical protein